MREIKFRVWLKAEAKMMNLSGWKKRESGSFVLYSQDAMAYQEACRFPDQFVWMQFTGLRDKNGKEVYEGDIIEQDDSGQQYEVRWVDQIGGFYLSIPKTHRGKEIISCAALQHGNDPIVLFTHSVIGNIYENPELLTSEQKAHECDATKE